MEHDYMCAISVQTDKFVLTVWDKSKLILEMQKPKKPGTSLLPEAWFCTNFHY